MSHLAELRTEIRSLDIAALAAQALGIPIHPTARTVRSYYTQANGEQTHRAELVFGTPSPHGEFYDEYAYRMGLQAQADGTYTLIGDSFMVAEKDLLKALGPDMHEWRMERGGHVCTGRPTSYLQEYALQTGIVMAQQFGMAWVRLPADPAEDDAKGEKIILTGGHLPPHMAMILVACEDGTCRVRFDGATDQSCYAYTKPLEDALGALVTDLPTLAGLNTCHVQQREHVTR